MLYNDIKSQMSSCSQDKPVKITEYWYDRLVSRKIRQLDISVSSNRIYSIENLWSPKQPINIRMAHFLVCIGMPELIDKLNKKELGLIIRLIPCLIIRYMVIKENLLSLKEIQAFLLTFIDRKDFASKELQVSRPDSL